MPDTELSLFEQIQALEGEIAALRQSIVDNTGEITIKQNEILSLYRQLFGATGSESIFNALTLTVALENPVASVTNNDPVQYTPSILLPGTTSIAALSATVDDLWTKCSITKYDWNWTSANVPGDPSLNDLNCVFTAQKFGANYRVSLSNAGTILTGTNDEKKLAIARLMKVWFTEVMLVTGFDTAAATTLEGLFDDQITAITANKDIVSEIKTALTV